MTTDKVVFTTLKVVFSLVLLSFIVGAGMLVMELTGLPALGMVSATVATLAVSMTMCALTEKHR